jgi:CheY-like chemotaxis protein
MDLGKKKSRRLLGGVGQVVLEVSAIFMLKRRKRRAPPLRLLPHLPRAFKFYCSALMSAKDMAGRRTKGVVLIVDDNPDDVELLRLAFAKAKAPCALMSAHDGAEAIRYLSGEGKYADRNLYPMPLLVLLDLNMPRVNGFDVLAWIQQHPSSTFPMVITLSYSHLESDIRRAYDLGTNAYIAKPVDLDSSVSLVKLLVNLQRMASVRPRRSIEKSA